MLKNCCYCAIKLVVAGARMFAYCGKIIFIYLYAMKKKKLTRKTCLVTTTHMDASCVWINKRYIRHVYEFLKLDIVCVCVSNKIHTQFNIRFYTF